MLEAMFEDSPNLLGNSLAESDGVASLATPRAGRGRITAASFRTLTARLKRQTYVADDSSNDAVAWPDIPDIIPGIIEPLVSAAVMAPDAVAVAPPPVVPEALPPLPSEIVLDEPLPSWAEENGPALDIAIPTFEPLAYGEASAALPDASLAPQPVESAQAEVEDAAPELEPAAAFEAIDIAVEPHPEAEDAVLPEAIAANGGADITEPLDADALEEAPVSVHAFAEAGQAEEIGESEVAALPEEPLPPQPEANLDEAAPESAQLAETLPATATADELAAEAATEVTDEIVTQAAEPVEPETIAAEAETPATAANEQAMGEDTAAVLKMLTKAIYSRPSPAERAAFLRDVADAFDSEAGVSSPDTKPAAGQLAELLAAPVEPVIEPPAAAIADSLASRLGPGQTLLRRPEGRDDPFNRPGGDIARPPVERPPGDEESGAHALSLIDMMISGSGTAQPQERALAADTLLHLIPRVPAKQLLTIVERLAIMEAPPPLVVAKLIRDPRAEIVGPLVERCTAITDQDLIVAVSEGDVAKRRIIARRRHVSAALSDTLIATGDPSVLLTLIRNPNAAFSHDAFYVLADKAAKNHNLLAPLATRNDLLAPVAFELFWHLPSELRRYVLSRFLTDSETLSKILKITRAADDSAEAKFPSREAMEHMTDTAIRGHIDSAAKLMAEAAAIDAETALRILSDREGEPLAVALKAMGQQRSKLGDVLSSLRSPDAGVLRSDRNVAELESIFDTLSFNKARILLTYWDWFVLKKGPYAPHH